MEDTRYPIPKAIEELCRLVSFVGGGVFQDHEEHDCFCGFNKLGALHSQWVSKKVIQYIEDAVNEKIERDKNLGTN